MSEYRRIEIALRKQVAGGQWPVGAMLPSRRDLAKQYSVSLVTLERAISPLLTDGTLRADDRRGTFVAASPPGAKGAQAEEMPATLPALKKEVGSVGIVASLTDCEGQEYQILHELEQVLSPRVRSLVVLDRATGTSGLLRLSEAIQSTLNEDIQALLVICLDLDRLLVAKELSRIVFGGAPAVCILAGELNLSLSHVFYDNRSGGFQAARHLGERGWNDLTVVAPFTASWVAERIAGIEDSLSHASVPRRLQILAGEGGDWEIFSDPRKFGYETARAALAGGWRPSGGGVIGINDGVALGVLDAAAEADLAAGRDFGLLGFDDGPLARAAGMTSLRPPMQGMAREAARLLLEHIAGNDSSLQVRLRAQVIPRASTRQRER